MGRTSLRNWAMEEFDIEKAKVKSTLQQSYSKIHLSFDIWTSPNGYAVLGAVGHGVFRNSEGFHN